MLFARDDMEQGNWTQEEYTVNATFPYVAGKVIERGQRIAFRDPATGTLEMFEVRNVTNIEPEHYQQIIAEHIVVAELSDEHIDTQEITDLSPEDALATVLTGTLWAVGTSSVPTLSSVDISRGSVWQAVGAVASNWNVYIKPRVETNSAGDIIGRYLDIAPSQGIWRGVRLSIDKNMSDASVVYDDTEVLTALYGYGGNVETTQEGSDDGTATLTFADIVWDATDEHPAKPLGQTYLEDPEKTALYGRNGRPRFGFYQNGDIKDATTLLEKTWAALRETSSPKISITGTVSDLYRMGYKDEPVRLHDMVIVEIRQTGEKFYLEVIKNDVDLIDPTATRPEIGTYIPNIVYINREANKTSGGGGGRGQDTEEYDDSETFSAIEKTNNMIALVVGTRNGENYIKAGEIGLAINKTGEDGSYESTAYINADHVNISATEEAHALAGDVEHDAEGRLVIKNAAGLYVERDSAVFGVWDEDNLTAGIIVDTINGDSTVQINADRIYLNGETTISSFFSRSGSATTFSADRLVTDYLSIGGRSGMSSAYGTLFRWVSKEVVTGVSVSGSHYFLYSSSSTSKTPSGTASGKLVSSVTTETIYYLGSGHAPNE